MNIEKYKKVAVLMGGHSAEHHISLMSGAAVLEALLRQGINAQRFDPAQNPIWKLQEEKFSHAFIMLHGAAGENGTIQGALEMMQIPYTGSGVMASSIAMDKLRTKLIWQSSGIITPPWCIIEEDTDFSAVELQLGLPLFIKVACGGSSIEVFKVKMPGELQQVYEKLATPNRTIIVERYIEGEEYTVCILDNNALPLVKIEPANEFYDYESKYFSTKTVYHCPCGLSEEIHAGLQNLGLKAFNALGGQGWGRVDMIIDKAGEAYLLEMNTVPGMTNNSLVPKAAKTLGLDFDQLVLKILDGAHVG